MPDAHGGKLPQVGGDRAVASEVGYAAALTMGPASDLCFGGARAYFDTVNRTLRAHKQRGRCIDSGQDFSAWMLVYRVTHRFRESSVGITVGDRELVRWRKE